MRGRPAVTRARLLNYVDKHWPCPIRQICRATGAERSYVKRVIRRFAEEGAITLPDHFGQHPQPTLDPVVMAQRARKRARRYGVIGENFTGADIARLRIAQNDNCALCGTDISTNFQVDHVKALARGGDNSPRNIQLTCPQCNALKQDKTIFAPCDTGE